MQEEIALLLHSSKGIFSLEDFEALDPLILHGYERCFEILGECAARLNTSLGERFPDVPWKTIAGLRNKVVHEYFRVDLSIIFYTIKNDLLALSLRIDEIAKILEHERSEF